MSATARWPGAAAGAAGAPGAAVARREEEGERGMSAVRSYVISERLIEEKEKTLWPGQRSV